MRMRHRDALSDADDVTPAMPDSGTRRLRLMPALPMALLLILGVSAAGYVSSGGGEAPPNAPGAARGATYSTSAVVAKVAPGGGPVAQGGVWDTKYGPMAPADRDFLVKVRLAGLWEGPAGRKGMQRSGNPLIKEASQHLIDGHADLDAKVIAIAREMGVALPTAPNEPTQEWLEEMDNAPSSAAFEQVFVDRLRAAHGNVYNLLAIVRSDTRNAMTRTFAEYSMTTVLDHMTVLEKTGLVTWEDMESPPVPAGVTGAAAEVAPTQYGPLSAADRDCLVRLRQAGLWQKPSGQTAQERSQNPQIKSAAQRVVETQTDLDAKATAIGQMFNVSLPSQPSAEQQGFINEMAAAPTPADFDSVFVNRVRLANGALLQGLAGIRAGSKNAMMRTFAEYAMKTVLERMKAMEQTRLVDQSKFTELPQPAAVGLAERNVNWIIIGLILLAATAISGVVLRELYGRR